MASYPQITAHSAWTRLALYICHPCTKFGAKLLIDAHKLEIKMVAAAILNLFPMAIIDILSTLN